MVVELEKVIIYGLQFDVLGVHFKVNRPNVIGNKRRVFNWNE